MAPARPARQTRDAYWQHSSVCDVWSRLTLLILAFGGWAGGYMNTVEALVRNAAGPVKGIIGLWVHLDLNMECPAPVSRF